MNAPQILANLREASLKVTEILTSASQLSRISFRGSDGVSSHATDEMRKMTVDTNTGSLFQAATAYREAIEQQIEALEKALLNYHSAEELNAISADAIEIADRPTVAGPNLAI
ncbi:MULTISPECIES: hypothetical protein [Actinoalloteichus]|uniref:Uncharacterized protein n=1 Tax=Actinoalloteichus fjordicus TaxID=1612552 RepID=A0AAC9L8Y1_9PSEU|nr:MULTISPECIES: hypothetical protein [Actinoalloteichus]APU12197.1 hypothetical protein UA74_00490 [Actinoalloteichus fjordicus]APU18149.1 hypothetical protein UA75_00490 [Actinoalloteichus sp. GBA129-24]